MPLPTYRVRLADGAIVFVDDLAYAKRTYPDAIIINRIVDGGMDNPVSEPYRGLQPGEKEAAAEAEKADEGKPAAAAENDAAKATKPTAKGEKSG